MTWTCHCGQRCEDLAALANHVRLMHPDVEFDLTQLVDDGREDSRT